MIKAENLVKAYGSGSLKITVLKGLDVEIESGEFVAIVGPSGAGKSTLLYQLSLLDEPTSGEVYFDEKKTSHLSIGKKTRIRLEQLGYVFQDYALLPELRAEENVILPLLMQGWPHRKAMIQTAKALARVGLDERKKNLPSQLSGGEQQRVSIARAIAHNPHILFADEPTANLDSVNGHRVMRTFEDLHREKQTIIMVTHEEEYADYARRIISIKDGMIVEDKKR